LTPNPANVEEPGMGQESTTYDNMHPASKWLLEVIANNKKDILTLRVAVLLAAWWIDHDHPPTADLIDNVASDLGTNRDAVERAFATLGWAGKASSIRH
jgi:hypothetical protein